MTVGPQQDEALTPGVMYVQTAVSPDSTPKPAGTGSISNMYTLDQPTATGMLNNLYVQDNPSLLNPMSLIFGVLRFGISLPLAIIEGIINALFGGGVPPGQTPPTDPTTYLSTDHALYAVSSWSSGVFGTIGAIINGIVGAFTGLLGGGWLPQDANAAMSAQAAATAANAAAIAELQAGINQGDTGGTSYTVDFSTLPDSVDLPSMFTENYMGTATTGGSRYGVLGGRAGETAYASDIRDAIGEYNLGDTTTDHQKVGAVFATAPGWQIAFPIIGSAYYGIGYLFCRYKDTDNWTRAYFKNTQTGGVVQLQTCVAGTITDLGPPSTDPVTANQAYWIEAGEVGGDRIYRVLQGQRVLLTFTDVAGITQVGPDFRGHALGGHMEGPFGVGYPAMPPYVLYYVAGDNIQAGPTGSQGRVYRANSALIAQPTSGRFAANTFDTIDYVTDDLTFDPVTGRWTVTKSRPYLVTVGARRDAPDGSIGVDRRLTLWRGTPAGQSVVRSGPSQQGLQMGASWEINLNAGDYVTAGSVTQAGLISLAGTANGEATYFEIASIPNTL